MQLLLKLLRLQSALPSITLVPRPLPVLKLLQRLLLFLTSARCFKRPQGLGQVQALAFLQRLL
jgi:hypothetical protein